MTAEVEHRGWEIESNYHEHFLDDPSIDLGDDFSEGNGGHLFGAILALTVLLVAIWGLKLWLTPPILNFPPAAVQIVLPQPPIPRGQMSAGPIHYDSDWRPQCLMVDYAHKMLRPNYGNPNCTPQAAKQRGEW